MSNKKRISKKINKLESKKFIKFISDIEFVGKQAEKAASIFMKVVEAMDNNTIKLRKLLDQRSSLDFRQTVNSNLRIFIDDVRKLTPLSYIEVVNVCHEIPEKYYEDFKNLLIVGFLADEALNLLRETYKF